MNDLLKLTIIQHYDAKTRLMKTKTVKDNWPPVQSQKAHLL
jgi:hypothetical protein